MNYEFRVPMSLRKLTVDDILSTTTVRSLLHVNKDTLQKADCRDFSVSQELAQCAELRDVRVQVSSKLFDLHQLHQLETLDAHCDEPWHLKLVHDFLGSAHVVPRTVRMYVNRTQADFTLKQAAVNFQRVQYLEIWDRLHVSAEEFLNCLRFMPPLQELCLVVSDLDFVKVVEGWTASTLPVLRKLCVRPLHQNGCLHSKRCVQTLT